MDMELNLNGLKLSVTERVYPPSDDTYLLMDAVKDIAKGLVLDVGAGTGAVALTAASKGCFTVAVDIDRNAARCTKLNITANKLRGLADVLVGDLVSAFKDRSFDLIVFNPPYLPVEEKGLGRAWSGGRSGRAVSDRFISEAPSKLKDEGLILLVQSSLSGIEEAVERFRRQGLEATVKERKRIGWFEELALVKASKKKP
ncbi:MAG: methyltransferase [Thermoprotei archaeon]|nr:MAG: methyltransferase [Thermoprotei archaeon]